MRYTLFENQKNALILLARVFLMVLFLIFGWMKLTNFSATAAHMAETGVPAPMLATVIAIAMEFFAGIAIVLGFYVRPLAAIYVIYTLATGFLGHHYWDMSGPAYMANLTNFYKNVSIAGGLLLLAVTGAGKYSLDRR